MRTSLLFTTFPLLVLAFCTFFATAAPVVGTIDGKKGSLRIVDWPTLAVAQPHLLSRDFKAADAWLQAEDQDLQSQKFKLPVISRDVDSWQQQSLIARGGFISKLGGGGSSNRQPDVKAKYPVGNNAPETPKGPTRQLNSGRKDDYFGDWSLLPNAGRPSGNQPAPATVPLGKPFDMQLPNKGA